MTDRVELAVSFDAPVCAGTLAALDDHVNRTEDILGLVANPKPIRAYWLADGEVDEVCREGRRGCFLPGTRLVFTQGGSLKHELVHAMLDTQTEHYFVEEGLSELLSGVGVNYNPNTSAASLSDQLSLSRAEYRDNGLDYTAAAHFMRWLYEVGGETAMQEMARTLKGNSSAGEVEERLRLAMPDAPGSIDRRYRGAARHYYAGLDRDRVEALDMQELREGLDVSLNCAEEDTSGPLPNNEGGLYRVFRVWIPKGAMTLEVVGSARAYVEVINPNFSSGQHWSRPEAALDPDAVRVRSGETKTIEITAREYLLLVVNEEVTPAQVTLRLTVSPLG